MRYYRVLAVLLSLLLCVSAFSACGGGQGNDPASEAGAADPAPGENDPAALRAYRAIVEDVVAHPENYYEADTFSDLSSDRFAVADIDNDGTPELLIRFVSSFLASWHTQIWKYDASSDSAKELLTCGAETEFYKTGYVKENASHNQMGVSLWPYELSKLEGDRLTQICGVYSEEKEIAGEMFPADQDADGDGIIYYRVKETDRQPMTAEEYAAFEAEYLPEDQRIEADYKELTPGNISAVFG